MLSAESLIRERLQTLPGVSGGVHGMAELDMQSVAGKRLPALFVACDGYRVVDAKSAAAAQVAVRWLVVVAVRQVQDVVGGTDARAAASDIARAVFAALYRWQPSPDYQPMQPVASPPRPEYASGVLLMPLVFETEEIIRRSEP